MLELSDKINILKDYLDEIGDTHVDSFKTDIVFYFNDFEDEQSCDFQFLNRLNSKEEIHSVIDHLISKIALKFDENEEQLSDFIFYALNP